MIFFVDFLVADTILADVLLKSAADLNIQSCELVMFFSQGRKVQQV